MTPANGTIPQFRASIGMQLVLTASSYELVGGLMDRIQRDFTGFNTHPCKAAVMQRMVDAGEITQLDYAHAHPSDVPF